MAIAGYNVFLGGVKQNSSLVTDLSYALSGLAAETQYAVTVSAVDDAGNESAQSDAVNFTTEPESGGTPVNSFSEFTNGVHWFDATDQATITDNGSGKGTDITDKISGKTLSYIDAAPNILSNPNRLEFVPPDFIEGTALSELSKNNDWSIVLEFQMDDAADNSFFGSSIDGDDRFGIGIREGELSLGYYDGSNFKVKSTTEGFSDTASKHTIRAKHISGVLTVHLDGVELTGSQSVFTNPTENYSSLGGQSNSSTKAFQFFTLFTKTGAFTTSEENYIDSL